MINYGWGREGQVFGNGEDYPRGSYYAVFLVSLFWHTLFLAVIKTQATHDWTIKTSLKKSVVSWLFGEFWKLISVPEP